MKFLWPQVVTWVWENTFLFGRCKKMFYDKHVNPFRSVEWPLLSSYNARTQNYFKYLICTSLFFNQVIHVDKVISSSSFRLDLLVDPFFAIFSGVFARRFWIAAQTRSSPYDSPLHLPAQHTQTCTSHLQ